MKAKIIKSYDDKGSKYIGKIGEARSLGFSAGTSKGTLEEVFHVKIDDVVLRCLLGEIEIIEESCKYTPSDNMTDINNPYSPYRQTLEMQNKDIFGN
jgi:hypothetical protein